MPDASVVGALTGRADEAPKFWSFTAALAALLLIPSALLLACALGFGGTDRARSAQVAWSIVLAVITLATLVRLARTGTTADEHGLRRTLLFGSRRIPWSTVHGLADGYDGRPGLWLYSNPSSVPTAQVPSSMHVWSPGEAAAQAERINATCELLPVPPRCARSGKATNRGRTWLLWTWWLPLLTLGLASPIVFLVGALLTRRRWLWLATAASLDLLIVFTAAGAVTSPDAGPVSGIAGVSVILGSSALLLTTLIVEGRRGRARARAGPMTGWPGSRDPRVPPAGGPSGGRWDGDDVPENGSTGEWEASHREDE
jgi:uncharacterized membrane protein YhaH (DUF805 family)